MKEAFDYAKDVHKQPPSISANPRVRAWVGRCFCYAGSDQTGKQLIMSALQNDPDNADAQRAIKSLKKANELKEVASAAFKKEEYK